LDIKEKEMDLLKFNYEKLHESIWNNHKVSWTVTSIFIPVLFAVQGYFVKEYPNLDNPQVIILVVIGMEFLLLVWLLIMRIFEFYNDARRDRVKEIEERFNKELRNGTAFKLYSGLDYKEKWKDFYFSPMTIYLIFFWAHTSTNMYLLSNAIAQPLILFAVVLIGLTHIVYYKLGKMSYWFSWDRVPGGDDKKLKKFLRDDLNIDWAGNAKIDKKNDGRTIGITMDENSAEIIMDEKKKKAILKISNKRPLNLIVKEENYKLKLYKRRIHLITYYLKRLPQFR